MTYVKEAILTNYLYETMIHTNIKFIIYTIPIIKNSKVN